MKKEQVIETLKNPHWFFFGKLFESDFEQIADAILALPLEVPSDEEIKKYAEDNFKNPSQLIAGCEMADWMREEIINRNK